MTDNMDMNVWQGLEQPSWTQDTLKMTEIDYGTIDMGCRGSAIFYLVNDTQEVQVYRLRRRKRARVPRFVFTTAQHKFTLKPKGEASITIDFSPIRPFHKYVDIIYVYCRNMPVNKIRLQGESKGPYIVPAVSQIILKTTVSTVAENQVELRNYSSVSGKFYFDLDNENSIFRFFPARSVVRGGETLAITIRFHPPFEGTVEKEVFCFAEFQDPISLHLIGVCGSSELPGCSPTIQRYPGLSSISPRRTTLEAYMHRKWESILEVKPGKVVVIPPNDMNTCFQVQNLTNDFFTLIWSPDAQQRFIICPIACHLYPKSTINFNAIKNTLVFQKLGRITGYNSNAEIGADLERVHDMAALTKIDGWLFWKPPRQRITSCSQPWMECQILSNADWSHSFIPVNFEVSFIGEHMDTEICLPQPECTAVPSTLIFPIRGHPQDYYTSFMIHANSCHKALYHIITPKSGDYIVKPQKGLINEEFQVIVVHHIPKFVYVNFKENWSIALNGTVTDKMQMNIVAIDNSISISFGDVGDTIHFAPTMVGCIQERKFWVRNNSPFWVRLSCTTEASSSILNVGQQKFIIGPNDDVIQKWEYRPLMFGFNYELVTYTVKQIRSPAQIKIEAIAQGTYLEENIDLTPAGVNVSSSHSFEDTDDDYDGQEKEFKIYAEILCRNEFPLMEPFHLYIDDFIATHHAAGSFALTNVIDARLSYNLFLLRENITNEPSEGGIDRTLFLDNSEYEIFPAQGILEPYQSMHYTCILFSTGMNPQKYSVVMDIIQTVDSDMFADQREFSLPPKKLGTITCRGAWPAVKIIDIQASTKNELFNPFTLWKCLNLDRINEALKSQPDPEIKTVELRFPPQPLHSNPIYRMKIQNVSQLPISWDVCLKHGELDMPPSINVPEDSGMPSACNNALKHLIALVKHQQNEAKNYKDNSYLRTIKCCPRRGQKKLDSSGHRIPVIAEECPLHSVVRFLPEKGIIMPGRSETIAVEVHHEMEGDFTFHFEMNFKMTDHESKVHQTEDILEEGKDSDVTRELGKVTGAIPKRRNPLYSKDLSHPLHLERTTKGHPQPYEKLSKALTGIQLESDQPALIRTGPLYESSDEGDTYNRDEDSLQCRTSNKCQEPLQHIQGNTIYSPCHKNKVCGVETAITSSRKCESSIVRKCSMASELVMHTLWGPDFELDSTSGDESTQSKDKYMGHFVKVSPPSYHNLPSRENIVSEIVPKIFTTTLKLYHSDNGSSDEDAKAMTDSKPTSEKYSQQQMDAQGNEWPNSREVKDQEVINNVYSAIMFPSSEEDTCEQSTHQLSQPEGKILLSPDHNEVKKRRHSAPESEIKEWEIQKPINMRSLSLGHIRVPSKLTIMSRSSSANSDSDTITDNSLFCSPKEKSRDKTRSVQMRFIRKIMLNAKSQENQVGDDKFFREPTKWAEASPEKLKAFESSPRGFDTKTNDVVQMPKNACDAFYESKNKLQKKPGETKKKRKLSKKRKKSEITKTEKNKKTSTKKKDSMATKLQAQEEEESKNVTEAVVTFSKKLNQKSELTNTEKNKKTARKKKDSMATLLQEEKEDESKNLTESVIKFSKKSNQKSELTNTKKNKKTSRKTKVSMATKLQEDKEEESENVAEAVAKFSKKHNQKSELTNTEKNKKTQSKKKDSMTTKLQEKDKESKNITDTGTQMTKKISSKFSKQKNRWQHYKKQLNIKPTQCIPLGYESASYGSTDALCGKESYDKEYTDCILDAIWMNGAFTHEKSSAFLPGQRQSYQPSSSTSGEEDANENKNDQMIYDRMLIRGTVNPDTATASKFNLCQQDEFQEKDHSVASPVKHEELKQIIDDLIIIENEEDTPQEQYAPVQHYRLPNLSSPPLATLQQSRLSIPNPTLLPNKAKETKVWIKQHPPIISSYQLQLSICTHNDNQEESPSHPTMYADKITLADACVSDECSSNQVTWIYNPHESQTFLLIVEFEDNIGNDKERVFKCINPVGFIFPKSIYPLIIQFRPKLAGPCKGNLKIKYNLEDTTVQVEGRGVHQRQQYFHSIQTDIPRLTLHKEPEFPFWVSDERIIINQLIPRTYKALRLLFIVNKSDEPVTFQWKSIIGPSALDCLVDISIIPDKETLTPYQVLPLLLSISKTKTCLIPTTSEEIEHIPRNLQYCVMPSNQGPINDNGDDPDLLVDLYLLNCNVTYSPSYTTEEQKEESNYLKNVLEATNVYCKPLAVSFGMCSERLALIHNEAPTHMCTDVIQPRRIGRVPNLATNTLRRHPLANYNYKFLIDNYLEGVQWKLLNSSWFSSVLEKLSKEGKTESNQYNDSNERKCKNLEDQPCRNNNTGSDPKNESEFDIMKNYKPPCYYNQIYIERQPTTENTLFPDVLEDQAFDTHERSSTAPLRQSGIIQKVGNPHMTGGTRASPSIIVHNHDEQETPTAFAPAGLVAQIFEECITRNIVCITRDMFEPAQVSAGNVDDENDTVSTEKSDSQS